MLEIIGAVKRPAIPLMLAVSVLNDNYLFITTAEIIGASVHWRSHNASHGMLAHPRRRGLLYLAAAGPISSRRQSATLKTFIHPSPSGS